jgi:hypothetical protein
MMFTEVKDLSFSELRKAISHVENHWREAVAFEDEPARINAVLLLHDLQLQLNRKLKGTK